MRPNEPPSFAAADEATDELKGSLRGLKTYVTAVRAVLSPEATEADDAPAPAAAEGEGQSSSGLG